MESSSYSGEAEKQRSVKKASTAAQRHEIYVGKRGKIRLGRKIVITMKRAFKVLCSI